MDGLLVFFAPQVIVVAFIRLVQLSTYVSKANLNIDV